MLQLCLGECIIFHSLEPAPPFQHHFLQLRALAERVVPDDPHASRDNYLLESRIFETLAPYLFQPGLAQKYHVSQLLTVSKRVVFEFSDAARNNCEFHLPGNLLSAHLLGPLRYKEDAAVPLAYTEVHRRSVRTLRKANLFYGGPQEAHRTEPPDAATQTNAFQLCAVLKCTHLQLF